MITVEQLKARLSCYPGADCLDDFTLQSIVDAVNSIEQCMIEAGYEQWRIDQVLMTAAVIIALYQVGAILQSRSVDDMSQSQGESRNDMIKNLEALLNTLDPNGCASGLIPTRPDGAFIFTTSGCC